MYNYGIIDNSYVIVMRRYHSSLRDWIISCRDKLPQKLKLLLKIYYDVLNIVQLLHDSNVTHYDIKADNLLLVMEGGEPVRVVMGDFGECKIFHDPKDELDMKSRGT
jgi:serine/threonine protein kinase